MTEKTKAYDLNKHTPEEGYVFCPHCAVKNPRSAYVCLKCYKVMFPNPTPLQLLRMKIPPSISIAIIFSALVFATLFLANKWLTNVEANMSLHIRTASYNLAVTADKKKRESVTQELLFERNPSN